MRAALYHRVSTLDQNASLARDELRVAAARLGCSVVLELEEQGSGARNDRPGLLRILRAARKHEIDVVMVWKLDRWGRSALDVLANLRELDAVGVRFVCTSQGLDVRPGGDAMSRLLLQVLAAVAEFERDLVRDRTRLGLARARARGAAIGRPKVPRPDVEAVQRAIESHPEMREKALADHVGCTLHALRDVLAEARARTRAAVCCECNGRNRHAGDCSRAQLVLPVEKGGAIPERALPRRSSARGRE